MYLPKECYVSPPSMEASFFHPVCMVPTWMVSLPCAVQVSVRREADMLILGYNVGTLRPAFPPVVYCHNHHLHIWRDHPRPQVHETGRSPALSLGLRAYWLSFTTLKWVPASKVVVSSSTTTFLHSLHWIRSRSLGSYFPQVAHSRTALQRGHCLGQQRRASFLISSSAVMWG